MKNTATEEVHDLSQMKVDELIGSLMTYELSLPKSEKKNKGLAVKSSITYRREQVLSDTDDDINDTIALLAKNYNRVMRTLNKISGKNVMPVVRDNQTLQQYQKGGNTLRNTCDGDKFNSNNVSKLNESNVMSVKALGIFRMNVPTF